MSDGRGQRWRAVMGFLVGGCLVGAGCHTSPLTEVCAPARAATVRMAGPDPQPDQAALLAPQTLLQWTITATRGQPLPPPVTGQSAIRADGRIDLGPYGLVPVAGLTTQQASDAIAKHMARYVPGAHVHLAAYLRPEAPGHTGRGGPDAGEVAPGPLTRTDYQPGDDTTEPQAGPPTLDAPGPLALGSAPEPPAGDKPPAPKDKDADNVKKDQSAAPQEQGKNDAVALAGPPLPPPGPGPGHAPNELHKVALPPYVIEPPDILLVEYLGTEQAFNRDQAIRGQHLVRPDGTISLGIYGSVPVAGLTLEQAKLAVYTKLSETSKLTQNALSVDVLAYNSKVYYVITDGAGLGEQIYRFPITGSETVLDALANIGGLPLVGSKRHVWVARRTPGCGPARILPVDYVGTTKGGLAGTNYQIMPGDRVYVAAERIQTVDRQIAKYLSPIERLFGATLLGSETVNSIKSGGTAGTGGVR